MRLFISWLAVCAVAIIAVTVSYQWLDRPIALAMHGGIVKQGSGWWSLMTRIPNPLVPLAGMAVVILAIQVVRGRALSRPQAAAFIAGCATVITEVLKEQLKFLFGRTWPETWPGGNPSFIRDGVYGFHFFHGGAGYNAFPSGHMATACAVLTVLWVFYPRVRPLCLLGGVAVGGALVIGNYHFLSDVIAGAFLGASIGVLAVAAWRAGHKGLLR